MFPVSCWFNDTTIHGRLQPELINRVLCKSFSSSFTDYSKEEDKMSARYRQLSFANSLILVPGFPRSTKRTHIGDGGEGKKQTYTDRNRWENRPVKETSKRSPQSQVQKLGHFSRILTADAAAGIDSKERERVCLCVCVCEREKEREKERKRERNIDTNTDTGNNSDAHC